MRLFTPFRVAAYLLVLFCTGHTVGGMILQKSLGPDADRVFADMKAVHFVFNGATTTWYGFWLGFGLTASVFLLLSAIVAWQLDKVPSQSWPLASTIAWALVAAHAVNTVLSWKYFFLGPAIFGVLITALLVVGIVGKRRSA